MDVSRLSRSSGSQRSCGMMLTAEQIQEYKNYKWPSHFIQTIRAIFNHIAQLEEKLVTEKGLSLKYHTEFQHYWDETLELKEQLAAEKLRGVGYKAAIDELHRQLDKAKAGKE